MLIIETLSLYLHIINSQTNLTTMKKQEMIDLILQEHDVLFNEYMEMYNEFGINDSATELAGTRLATISQLIKKLGL